MRLSTLVGCLTVALIIVAVIGSFGFPVSQVQAASVTYQGTAFISGSPAPAGTLVQVFVSGKSMPCSFTYTTEVNGSYSITISDSGGNCPDPGSSATLWVGGQFATSVPFSSSTPSPVILPLTAGAGTTGMGHFISGRALSSTGQPLSGATVQALIGGTVCATTTTDALGNFSFTVASNMQIIGCGTNGATISFRVAGQLVPQTVSFLSGGSTTNLTLTSGAPTTLGAHFIAGRVVNVAGTPLSGVVVQALIGSTVCATATTDAAGNFSLSVPAATTTIGCGATGSTVSFQVAGQTASQTVSFLSGGYTSNLVLVIGATLTPTPTPTPTPTVTVTPTVSPARWLAQPPSPANPSAQTICPAPERWLLAYWGGPAGIAISAAVNACPNVDLVWVNRAGVWYGFSTRAAQASDNWNVIAGEAHFLHGQ